MAAHSIESAYDEKKIAKPVPCTGRKKVSEFWFLLECLDQKFDGIVYICEIHHLDG